MACLAAVQHLIKDATIDTTDTLAGSWVPVSEFEYHAFALYEVSAAGGADIDYYIDIFVGTEGSTPPTAATTEYVRVQIVAGVTTESTWLLYQPDLETKSVFASGACTWIRAFVEGGAANSADTVVSVRLLSR